MLTPIELIKATVDGMAERGFGRIVNITSSAVKAPIDVLGLSNGARSGLTGFVAGLARQSRLASAQRDDQQPAARRLRHRPHADDTERPGRQDRQVGRTSCRTNAAPRFPPNASARSTSSAQICAFLCSAQAGYLTGQNILLDGGAYPGTY